MRNLRQRIGLVHELRELRGAEELADGGHDRLGVDEVVRHRGVQFLIHAHFFFNRTFHAHQADAELVFHQLAQLEQVADGRVEVIGRQGAVIELRGVLIFVELDVELQAAHPRKVVLARIEEHAFEEGGRGVERGRIARTQLAVDLDQRLFRLVHRVALERVRYDIAHVVAVGEEDLETGGAGGHDLVQAVGRQLHIGFHNHFARRGIDRVGSGERAVELGGFHFHLADAGGAQRLERMGRNLAARVRDFFLAVQDPVRRLHTHKVRTLRGILLHFPLQLAVGDMQAVNGVESLQDLLVGAQAQSAQEDGSQELALAVDAHVERVLLVVLELHPRAAVGNDLAQEVGAVVRGLKKHAR